MILWRSDFMDSNNMPLHVEELTPRWMTRLFREQGLIDNLTTVRQIKATEIGNMAGANSDVVFLNIGYEDGIGPTKIIAKNTPKLGSSVANFQRWFEREVDFYRVLAPSLRKASSLVLPQSYYAEYRETERGTEHLLLLEPLAAENQGDQLQGCSYDEAKRALGALASLHATYWDCSDEKRTSWLPYTTVGLHNAKPVQNAFRNAWKLYKQSAEITPQTARLIDQAVDDYPDLLQSLSIPPVSIIHGDFRLDNLFFSKDFKVAAIDWQFTAKARGIYDVAYFLTLSMDKELEQDKLLSLLSFYNAELKRLGTPGYLFQELLENYSTSVFLTFAVFVIGAVATPPGRMAEVHKSGIHRARRAIEALPGLPSLFS
jgi:hypothetical protein